ncbi:MAG: LacI family DNA-binding transcriptional regulator [Luteolibacter sp.]
MFTLWSTMDGTRVTLKQIAAALGLSVPTVSMALRGHREIAEATRAKVRAKAEELGYRPDPAMRALADYRTRQRSTSRRWDRIALLHDWASEEAWRNHDFYGTWHAHLARVAADRGIEVEEHWLGAGAKKADAVFRALRHRGITGLLLAPPGLTTEPREIGIPRGGFQIVTFGPGHLYREYHTVQFDFYENLRLAWAKLREKGHRRIGLLYQEHQGWRTGQAWRAAYHIEKLEAGWKPGEIMPLMIPSANDPSASSAYHKWLRCGRYDAVISSIYQIDGWNRELTDPPEVAFFNVRAPGQQGIDLNLPQLIRSAFELLYVEMQQTLVERHDLPFRIHIPGRWVDGARTSVRQ